MSENKIIRMCGVEPESIVDGPGFRYVVFVQGCPHRCPGCHNPESHDFEAGFDMTVDEIWEEIESNPHLGGVTFSGGEPFCQAEVLVELARRVKNKGLSLMSYSGWTYEELCAMRNPAVDEILSLLDLLVDGRYIEAQRNLTLVYRGSENQRVIDMVKTREQGEIVLYQSEFDVL